MIRQLLEIEADYGEKIQKQVEKGEDHGDRDDNLSSSETDQEFDDSMIPDFMRSEPPVFMDGAPMYVNKTVTE